LTLGIRSRAAAQTPRFFGVNVEIQDHAAETNLWDWVAEGGFSVVRTFHPEVTLRREGRPYADRSDWDQGAFDSWRQEICADPDATLDWSAFLFDEAVPSIGVPDEVIGHYRSLGLQPLVSLAFAPKEFERCIVTDLTGNGPVGDDDIDWGAAAAAYEYYRALIHRYGFHQGCNVFTMLNEPENRWGWWYVDDELAAIEDGWWERLFDDQHSTLGVRYLDQLARQYGVLARIARMAIDDHRQLAAQRGRAAEATLIGPTTVTWEVLWKAAEPRLDVCDVHHYHPDQRTFASLWQTVAERAGNKPAAFTEFNRHSGGVPIEQWLFNREHALELADLLFTLVELSKGGDPAIGYATLYLLHFPSTHRNYKHLLYGDFDVLDWTLKDTSLLDRGDAWYPTLAETQIRHATPAWHLVRMCTRFMRAPSGATGPFPVYPVGHSNPSSSGPDHRLATMRCLAVEQGAELLLGVLNTGSEGSEWTEVDLGDREWKSPSSACQTARRQTRSLRCFAHPMASPALRCRPRVSSKFASSHTTWPI
jgi:hypothetical protein